MHVCEGGRRETAGRAREQEERVGRETAERKSQTREGVML